MSMSEFVEKAGQFEDKHDADVDKGVQKAAEGLEQRTGGEHKEQIDKAAEEVEKHD
jgi:hypothetical protein